LVDQSLDLVGGTLVTEKTQNDADGFFRDNTIDAGLGGQPSNQFVHIAPPSAGLLPGRPCEFILSVCDLKYKRSAHAMAIFVLDRAASVAAMQE
jgi:hypothetical protein